MKQKTKTLQTGKLDIDKLRLLLERNTILDPQVVIGPKIGEDAAVIDLGRRTNRYWVVTSDPITFTAEEIGYYGVVVNLNDIAAMGQSLNGFWPPSSSRRNRISKSSKKSSGRSMTPVSNSTFLLSAGIQRSHPELKK